MFRIPLRLRQFQQPRQKQRTHLSDSGAHRVALIPEEIPERDWEGSVGEVSKTDLLRPVKKRPCSLCVALPALAKTRQVALHI